MKGLIPHLLFLFVSLTKCATQTQLQQVVIAANSTYSQPDKPQLTYSNQ